MTWSGFSSTSRSAKRPTLVERVTKWSRRHSTAVWAAAVASLIGLAGLTVSNTMIGRRNAEIIRKSAELESQRDEINRALTESEEARVQAETASRFLVDAFRRVSTPHRTAANSRSLTSSRQQC